MRVGRHDLFIQPLVIQLVGKELSFPASFDDKSDLCKCYRGPAMASEKRGFECLPEEVRHELEASLRELYGGRATDAAQNFDATIRKLEEELGSESWLVDDLCLKLARDLNAYASEEEGSRLLEGRRNRAKTFRASLNCALLGDTTALRDEDPKDDVRLSLTRLLLNGDGLPAGELDRLSAELETAASPEDEDRVFCLILCHQRLAFLFKRAGDRNAFLDHHRTALDLCKLRDWDVGLEMELRTGVVRALKSCGRSEEVLVHVDALLDVVDRVLDPEDDRLEVGCGLRTVREAYNDVSVACSFHEAAQDRLLSTGEKLYATWKRKYGPRHPEVIFVASQLAYNYASFYRDLEADRYLEITEKELDSFPETTRRIMQAKAKTLIHVWKIHRNKGELTRAEEHCREELRLNRKHGISQQYVANALRNLAFIVRDQGRRDEGLDYLRQCLDLSRRHRPDLTSFHDKVQNEIKKF